MAHYLVKRTYGLQENNFKDYLRNVKLLSLKSSDIVFVKLKFKRIGTVAVAGAPLTKTIYSIAIIDRVVQYNEPVYYFDREPDYNGRLTVEFRLPYNDMLKKFSDVVKWSYLSPGIEIIK
jgi:hypothetical protein